MSRGVWYFLLSECFEQCLVPERKEMGLTRHEQAPSAKADRAAPH